MYANIMFECFSYYAQVPLTDVIFFRGTELISSPPSSLKYANTSDVHANQRS